MARTSVPAVSPYADTVGYCRAVRDGRHIYVSGTAPVGIESDDPYEQAKRCLTIIVDALRELGAGPEHVVRTRVYIVDPAEWEGVGRAHGEVFGAAPSRVGDARDHGAARPALEGRDRGRRAASRVRTRFLPAKRGDIVFT